MEHDQIQSVEPGEHATAAGRVAALAAPHASQHVRDALGVRADASARKSVGGYALPGWRKQSSLHG